GEETVAWDLPARHRPPLRPGGTVTGQHRTTRPRTASRHGRGVELRAAASPGPRPNTLGDRPDTRPQGRTRDEAAPRGSLAPPPPAAGTGRRPPAPRGRAGIRVPHARPLRGPRAVQY